MLLCNHQYEWFIIWFSIYIWSSEELQHIDRKLEINYGKVFDWKFDPIS